MRISEQSDPSLVHGRDQVHPAFPGSGVKEGHPQLMTNSDDETIPEQSVLEQPALEQPALEKPAHWAEARVTRILIAATIVLGSAGAGFLAGHVWPMTGFSGSAEGA